MKITHLHSLFLAIACLLAACADAPQNAPQKSTAPEALAAPEAPAPAQPTVTQADTSRPKAEAPAPEAPSSEAKAAPKSESVVGKKHAQKPEPSPANRGSAGEKTAKSGIPAGFSDVAALDASIGMDIRYATTNNFTKAKIYDCPRCLLRPEAAEAVAKAHKALQKQGLGLKMFDCYRPRPYQQRLWDKVPDPNYVTPPAKGSMHGRGLAVDLTIVDKNGRELDMGTPYDFFGEEAHTDYTKHPATVLANRRLLREALEAVGFKGIRTEWWHFSYQLKDYPLCEEVWICQ